MLQNDMMLLAGDIGGTKTTLAVYSFRDEVLVLHREQTFVSKEYASFYEILEKFLKESVVKMSIACFGVAGPVIAGQARLTNRPWTISEAQVKARYGIEHVKLMNDVEALACAVPYLKPEDLETIHVGAPMQHGARSVIAVGTGLGHAFLCWSGSKYLAHASEYGHVHFAPQNASEQELLNYCLAEFGHVSCERVCSGTGILNLYNFLAINLDISEPEWLRRQILQSACPVSLITENARMKKSALCLKTLDLFVSILGSAAGNLSLTLLPTGGLYLGGGIPPRITDMLKSEAFVKSFSDKGPMGALLKQIPIYVILDPKAPLWGAAHYCLNHYRDSL